MLLSRMSPSSSMRKTSRDKLSGRRTYIKTVVHSQRATGAIARRASLYPMASIVSSICEFARTCTFTLFSHYLVLSSPARQIAMDTVGDSTVAESPYFLQTCSTPSNPILATGIDLVFVLLCEFECTYLVYRNSSYDMKPCMAKYLHTLF